MTIDALPLADIQSTIDTRGIALPKVGLRRLKYPIFIRNQVGQVHEAEGEFSLSIGLAADKKGAHLSRFIQVLHPAENRLFSTRGEGLISLLSRLQTELESPIAQVSVFFPFFMEKAAPVSELNSWMHYRVGFSAEKYEEQVVLRTHLTVPVTSVCPCSKAISDAGAHNQRALLNLAIQTGHPVPVEYWIAFLEQQGSAPVYPLLKRPDEKWVTEQAYHNAKFVEDIVRDVASCLQKDKNIRSYHISAQNIESIHGHDAFAEISSSA